MTAIEDEYVQKQRKMFSGEEQIIFMMTYECFVMWCLLRGLATLLTRQDVEHVRIAIHDHFTKHARYRQNVFEKIWEKMQDVMPMAMTSTPDGVPPLPVAEMFMAPTLAGFKLDLLKTDLEFGVFVGLAVSELETTGHDLARINQSS